MITKLYNKVDSLFNNILQNLRIASSFNSKSFKEEIKKLVEENQLQKAIERCLEITRQYPINKHLENDFLNLTSRIKQLEKENILELILNKDYEVKKEAIRLAVLKLIKKIKLPHQNRFFLYLKLLAFPIGLSLSYFLYFFIFPPTFVLGGHITNEKCNGVSKIEVWSNINGKEVTTYTNEKGEFFFTIKEDHSGIITFKYKCQGMTTVGTFRKPHIWKGKRSGELKRFPSRN